MTHILKLDYKPAITSMHILYQYILLQQKDKLGVILQNEFQ